MTTGKSGRLIVITLDATRRKTCTYHIWNVGKKGTGKNGGGKWARKKGHRKNAHRKKGTSEKLGKGHTSKKDRYNVTK